MAPPRPEPLLRELWHLHLPCVSMRMSARACSVTGHRQVDCPPLAIQECLSKSICVRPKPSSGARRQCHWWRSMPIGARQRPQWQLTASEWESR
eukprot:8222606-Alexandrium_andersonii.AAC.1